MTAPADIDALVALAEKAARTEHTMYGGVAGKLYRDLSEALTALSDAIATLTRERDAMAETLKQIAVGEVDGDPNHALSMYRRARVMALAVLTDKAGS